jgi:hypothetical protein
MPRQAVAWRVLRYVQEAMLNLVFITALERLPILLRSSQRCERLPDNHYTGVKQLANDGQLITNHNVARSLSLFAIHHGIVTRT